ncbi:MAG: hypothetical protein DRP71_09570 [Verrucomicrobia bacterium]|nr:MAG: hypothetical protein DRP71_09570 [Verrucomicrobiota bacterium]
MPSNGPGLFLEWTPKNRLAMMRFNRRTTARHDERPARFRAVMHSVIGSLLAGLWRLKEPQNPATIPPRSESG